MRYRLLTLVLLCLVGCSRAPSQAEIVDAANTAVAATAQAQPTALPATPTPDPCAPTSLTTYGTATKALLAAYFVQLELAQSTPRISLGVTMQALLANEQAVNAATPPPCLADWFGRTKNMMELYRTAMNQFAAQDESNSANNMAHAANLRTVIEAGLTDIIAGKVPVSP